MIESPMIGGNYLSVSTNETGVDAAFDCVLNDPLFIYGLHGRFGYF